MPKLYGDLIDTEYVRLTMAEFEAGLRPIYDREALRDVLFDLDLLRAAARRVLDGWDDNLPSQEEIELLRKALHG